MKKAGVIILINVLWFIAAAGAWAYDYEPTVAYDPVNDRYMVVYDRFVSSSERSYVTVQLVDNQGTAIGEPVDINTTDIYLSPYPSVVYDAAAAQFLVVWQQDSNTIYGRFVAPDGTPSTAATLISNASGYTETTPVVAYDPVNGQSLVVWQSFDNISAYQYVIVGALVRLDSQAPALERDAIQTLAVGDGINYLFPCVAFDTTSNRYLIAWSRQSAAAASIGLEAAFVTTDLQQTTPLSIPAADASQYPAVSYDSTNDNFLLVWVDETTPADYNILGTTIQSDGSAADPITISAASGNQLFPAVAFDAGHGGFIVTWEDLRSATDYDIYGQWVTNEVLEGAAFEVAGGTGDQQSAAMAYNTTCDNMITAFSSSAAGENVIDYAITGVPCVAGLQVVIPGGATVADYRMITFPVTAQPEMRLQIFEQLGGPDSTQWRMLRWDPDTEAYMEITDEVWVESQACIPGRAYWFISRFETTLTVYGDPSPSTGYVNVVLRQGWNQIASPYDFSVEWNADITVTDGTVTPEPITTTSLIDYNGLMRYENGTGTYVQEATALFRSQGYWLYNDPANGGDLTLAIPANRYTGSIWRDLRQMVTRWVAKFPQQAVASGSSSPPPPPGALETAPDSGNGGCFITATTFFNAE